MSAVISDLLDILEVMLLCLYQISFSYKMDNNMILL